MQAGALLSFCTFGHISHVQGKLGHHLRSRLTNPQKGSYICNSNSTECHILICLIIIITIISINCSAPSGFAGSVDRRTSCHMRGCKQTKNSCKNPFIYLLSLSCRAKSEPHTGPQQSPGPCAVFSCPSPPRRITHE